MTWAVIVCLRIRLIPSRATCRPKQAACFYYYNIITSPKFRPETASEARTQAGSELSELGGKDGVEGASGYATLYIPETGIFEQSTVLGECALFAFCARQHVQGLKLG
jgi:hypothetical protein